MVSPIFSPPASAFLSPAPPQASCGSVVRSSSTNASSPFSATIRTELTPFSPFLGCLEVSGSVTPAWMSRSGGQFRYRPYHRDLRESDHAHADERRARLEPSVRLLAHRQRFRARQPLLQPRDGLRALRPVLVSAHRAVPAGPHPPDGLVPPRRRGGEVRAAAGRGGPADGGLP